MFKSVPGKSQTELVEFMYCLSRLQTLSKVLLTLLIYFLFVLENLTKPTHMLMELKQKTKSAAIP